VFETWVLHNPPKNKIKQFYRVKNPPNKRVFAFYEAHDVTQNTLQAHG
jgi:hypothetical protein